jgi:hypothetical protein
MKYDTDFGNRHTFIQKPSLNKPAAGGLVYRSLVRLGLLTLEKLEQQENPSERVQKILKHCGKDTWLNFVLETTAEVADSFLLALGVIKDRGSK